MAKEVDVAKDNLKGLGNTGEKNNEPFGRSNVFYRSFERLRRGRKTRKDVTSTGSGGEVFEDGIPPVEQEWFSARDGSQRKGSAPAELETDKKRASCDPSKVNKGGNGQKMTRPFSNLFTKKEEYRTPSPSTRPDFFKDVKLKKTVTEQKLVPKTTERHKLFEGVYQVSIKVDEETGKLKPVVSWSYPPLGTTKLTGMEKSILDFAFPDLDLLENRSARSITETYAFVQTNMTAERIIGYCRRFKYKETPAGRLRSGTEASVTQSTKSLGHKLTRVQKKLINIRVWCIVTKLHCFDTFSAIFDKIHSLRQETASNADVEVYSFLRTVGENAAPLPGNTVQIQYVSKLHDDNTMGSYEIKRPGPEDRMSLLQHPALLNYLPKNMLITIMIALFTESKLLFLDKTLSSLTSTLHALTSLLHPLEWVCIYIPMLSVGVRDIVRDLVLSPSPYVIGMLKEDYSKVREHELKDTRVLVIDLTKKKMSDLRDDEANQLPISEASRKKLKNKLRVIKQKKDQLKQCEVWGGFIEPFLSYVNDITSDAETKNGFREMDLSSYKEKIKSNHEGDENFAEQLFNTQMSQLWLQQQKISIVR